MKRIISFILFMALGCAMLTGAALAAEHDYPEIPFDDYTFAASILDPRRGHVLLIVPSGCEMPYISNEGNRVMIELPAFKQYLFDAEQNAYVLQRDYNAPTSMQLPSLDTFTFVSHDLCDLEGNVILPATITTGSSVVLPSAVSADSLTGALGEVASMLAVALPVVAGLFGIRKGIAFLIGRIRGV